MRILIIPALALMLAACTDGQRVGVSLITGALSTAQAAQCEKPLDRRMAEWEATGRKVEPLDCDGDGYADFGPNAKPE